MAQPYQGKKLSPALIVLLVILSIGLLAGFQYMSGRTQANSMKDVYSRYTAAADAKVVSVTDKGKIKASVTVYTVKFLTADKQEITATVRDNVSKPVPEGGTMPVLYDPAQPLSCDSKAQIAERTSWISYTMFSFLQ